MRVVSKVAQRTRSSEMRLMALYIQSKLGGASGIVEPARPVPVYLNVMCPRDKAASDKLKRCTCLMSTSMQCKCGMAPNIFESQNKRKIPPSRKDRQSSHSSPESKSSGSRLMLEPRFNDCNRWKMSTIRKRIGNVTIDADSVFRAVERCGGLECVDGKQGTKGKGWSAVAESMGIKVERNRDAGYQIKKIYWLGAKQRRFRTGKRRSEESASSVST